MEFPKELPSREEQIEKLEQDIKIIEKKIQELAKELSINETRLEMYTKYPTKLDELNLFAADRLKRDELKQEILKLTDLKRRKTLLEDPK